MQLVKYDQPRYLAVALAIDSTKSRTVLLWPGINELSDKDWLDVKSHPVVLDCITAGQLTEVSSKPGTESILGTMTEVKATETIAQTDNVELLKKWIMEEKRPYVIKSLSDKLQFMVLPDRRETKSETPDTTDDEFPRADKIGSDKVAAKIAGKTGRSKR